MMCLGRTEDDNSSQQVNRANDGGYKTSNERGRAMTDFAQPIPMRGRLQPSRESVIQDSRLHVLDHPLATSLVTTLRNSSSPSHEFEWAIHELTQHLIWNALTDEPIENFDVSGFSGEPTPGTRFRRRIALLAILRAGLGMVPPARALIPDITTYQIGIKRDEQTLEPRCYSSNLPESFGNIGHLLILDPMLATGGSAHMALQQVRQRFDGTISFIGMLGAPYGVAQLLGADPTLRIFLAALDDRLNEQGYILPGLGDAGDRLFGTL